MRCAVASNYLISERIIQEYIDIVILQIAYYLR